MTLRTAIPSALLVVLTSCGGGSGGGSDDALAETARRLGEIRSARIDLRLTATSEAAKGPVGFTLSGPFALPEKEGLPVADVRVAELRGATSVESRFVSTGQAAYVVANGRTTPVPGDAGISVGGASGGGLGELRIDGWLRDPSVSDGGDVGGTSTDKISAGLDVARAFDDVARLGERLGARALAGLKPLDDRARAQLERAARDARIEVWTGKEDRLLRKLVLSVTLTAAGEVPEGLRSLVPVSLSLSLDLAAVNEPVKVEPPST